MSQCPTSDPNCQPTTNDDEVWSTGLIIAVVVAAVAVGVLLVTVIVVWAVIRRRRRPKREKRMVRDFKISTLERTQTPRESPRRKHRSGGRHVSRPVKITGTGGIFVSRPVKTKYLTSPRVKVTQQNRQQGSPAIFHSSMDRRGTRSLDGYGNGMHVSGVSITRNNTRPPSPTSWHQQYKVVHNEDPKFRDYYYRIYPQGNQDNLKEYDYIPIKVAPGVLDTGPNRPGGLIPNGGIPTQTYGQHTSLVPVGSTIPIGNPSPLEITSLGTTPLGPSPLVTTTSTIPIGNPAPLRTTTLDSRMSVQHHGENTRIAITGNDPPPMRSSYNPRESRVSVISNDARDAGFQAPNPDPNYSRISIRGGGNDPRDSRMSSFRSNDPRDAPAPPNPRDSRMIYSSFRNDDAPGSRMSSFRSNDPRDSHVPMRQGSIEKVTVHQPRLSNFEVTREETRYSIPPAPPPPPPVGGGGFVPPAPPLPSGGTIPPLPYGDLDQDSETYSVVRSDLIPDHRVSVALA